MEKTIQTKKYYEYFLNRFVLICWKECLNFLSPYIGIRKLGGFGTSTILPILNLSALDTSTNIYYVSLSITLLTLVISAHQ
jgi:hypothetical protein